MTSAFSIARPYAKAVLQVAKASGMSSFWSQALQQLAIAIQDAQVQSMLKNPFVTNQQLHELLMGFLRVVCGNDVTSSYKQMENFLHLLAEQKRFRLLSAIAELFQEYIAAEAGCLQLTVTSAFAMNHQQQQRIKEKLTEQLQAEVVAEFQVNHHLIGGVSIRSNKWVLDDSVAGNLQRLTGRLLKRIA